MLLDFGAQINFYYKTCGDKLASENDIYWWYRRGVDYPPLFTAVRSGKLEIVSLLLERGADPERYNPSPLYRAVKDNRRDIIPVLLQYGVGPQDTAMELAVLSEDESMVRLLLDNGFNVPEYAHSGLYAAGMMFLWNIFELLKSRGATMDAVSDVDQMLCVINGGECTITRISSSSYGIHNDEGVDELQPGLYEDAYDEGFDEEPEEEPDDEPEED